MKYITLLFFHIIIVSISNAQILSEINQKENLLCKNTWKLEEFCQTLRFNENYFKRGAKPYSYNTINFESDSIKFFPDNTGYSYFMGESHPLVWNFLNPEKSEIKLVIDFPGEVNGKPLQSFIQYENLKVGEGFLAFSRCLIGAEFVYLK